MRNPRAAKFTEEQEAALAKTEALMTRARIMERGVAAILNNGDYASASEIEVAADVLSASVKLRIECETERAAIRQLERSSHPNPTSKVHVRRRRG